MDTTEFTHDPNYKAQGSFPDGTRFYRTRSSVCCVLIPGYGFFFIKNDSLYELSREKSLDVFGRIFNEGRELSFEDYLAEISKTKR